MRSAYDDWKLATPPEHEGANEVECPDCKGFGMICVGTSGQDCDGNAPILEQCETCDSSGTVLRR
jgi:RecJ-like exonuclease